MAVQWGNQMLPNIPGSIQQGYAIGTQMKQQRQAEQDRNALRALAPGVIGGDPNALTQAATINATEAGKYDAVGVDIAKRGTGAATYLLEAVKRGNPQEIEGRYQAVRPFLEKLGAAQGKTPPPNFDPAMVPLMEQLVAKGQSMGGVKAEQRNLSVSPGSAIVDPETGKVVYERPFAPDRPQNSVFQVDAQGRGWWLSPGQPPVPADQAAVPADAPAPTTGGGAQVLQDATSASMGSPKSDYLDVAAQHGFEITSLERPVIGAGAGANSQHPKGTAVDYSVRGKTPEQIAALKTDLSSRGYEVIDESDGKTGTGPHIHAELPPGGNRFQTTGAVTQGIQFPRKGEPSELERERLRLAQEANQRAAAAADRAARGNPPAGFRWNAQGTALEAIPGGPKPAGAAATEGERKASTLLQRIDSSLQQLQTAVSENPDAAAPSVMATIAGNLPVIGEVARNTVNSSERQRVEAAQLDILDAALTLGTGAAYTKEQLEGYRKSYFPQINDSDDTIKDKEARLETILRAARTAAGRAAPPADQAPPAGAPQPGTVEDGYRFRGGNPSDPANWERV